MLQNYNFGIQFHNCKYYYSGFSQQKLVSLGLPASGGPARLWGAPFGRLRIEKLAD